MPEQAHADAAARGRIGGLTRAATANAGEQERVARAAFMARFEREVDPERVLSESERHRRAALLRRAYFARLALLSVQSRRRKTAKKAAASAVAEAAS